MSNHSNLRPLFLLSAAFFLATLAPSAIAGKACYVISNFAVPNYVNLTLNGTKFMLRLNFIGPNSAGITINESKSYTLPLNMSQVIGNTTNYTISSELLNVSWLPVEHTVTVNFCSAPNAPVPMVNPGGPIQLATTSSTTTTSTILTTTASTTITTITVVATAGPQGIAGGSPDETLVGVAAILVVAALLAGLYFYRRRRLISTGRD